jgi:hypothetical protein
MVEIISLSFARFGFGPRTRFRVRPGKLFILFAQEEAALDEFGQWLDISGQRRLSSVATDQGNDRSVGRPGKRETLAAMGCPEMSSHCPDSSSAAAARVDNDGRQAGDGDEESAMQPGMIGRDRIGAHMFRRLIGGGHECVAFAMFPKAVAERPSRDALEARRPT